MWWVGLLRFGTGQRMLNTPLQMILVMLAGWVNEEQRAVIDRFGVRVPGGALAGSPCSVRTSGFLVALSWAIEMAVDAPKLGWFSEGLGEGR